MKTVENSENRVPKGKHFNKSFVLIRKQNGRERFVNTIYNWALVAPAVVIASGTTPNFIWNDEPIVTEGNDTFSAIKLLKVRPYFEHFVSGLAVSQQPTSWANLSRRAVSGDTSYALWTENDRIVDQFCSLGKALKIIKENGQGLDPEARIYSLVKCYDNK